MAAGMKLTEVADQEPFVVTMMRKILAKGEPLLLVIVQEGGALSRMGTIRALRVTQRQHMDPEYVLEVFTNMEQEYTYGAQRLRRADIRQHKWPGKGTNTVTAALYVPSSGNTEDLGGHDL